MRLVRSIIFYADNMVSNIRIRYANYSTLKRNETTLFTRQETEAIFKILD